MSLAFLLNHFGRIRGILFSAKMPPAKDAKDINVALVPWWATKQKILIVFW
jgi:hypothetical protein